MIASSHCPQIHSDTLSTIKSEPEPRFYYAATPGYGQETRQFCPTKTESLSPTVTFIKDEF